MKTRPKTPTLALNMIFRNNEDTIKACVDSILPWVDEAVFVDTGCTDNTKTIIRARCDEHCIPFHILDYDDPKAHPQWISDFSAPRNVAWEATKSDIIVWLDTDDVWMERVEGGPDRVGAASLRNLVDTYCGDGHVSDNVVDLINVRYDYSHDAYGYVNLCQPRWRVARKSAFVWDEPVHENLRPKQPVAVAGKDDEWVDLPFYVKHSGDSDPTISSERNLWIMEQWEADGKELRGRHLSGMAASLYMLGRYQEAIDRIDQIDPDELHDDEVYTSLIRKGLCLRQLNKDDDALDCFGRAERLVAHYSEAYLNTVEVLVDRKQWASVLSWCEKADAAEGDALARRFNPQAKIAVVAKSRAKAFDAMEAWESAFENYKILANMFPNDQEIVCRTMAIQEALRRKGIADDFMKVMEHFDNDDDRETFRNLAPVFLRAFPVFSMASKKARPIGRPSVAIYCGKTTNAWGPHSIETGTGGSEESAIYVSRELVKLGYFVEVYCNVPPDDVGTDEYGVRWYPYHAWSPNDRADIFVNWRQIKNIHLGSTSDQVWQWIQDIPLAEYYTPEVCESLDGILPISDFQKGHLGDAGMAKSTVTANGVQLNTIVSGHNHHDKFIYASSPDRGLLELLTIWPKISEALPDAELHIFYGFRDVYESQETLHSKANRMRNAVEALMGQPGIINHGMVGQTELHYWFAQCGFWLYPTSFEEAFCITAAKAQCMGAIPITSRELQSCLVEVCGSWDLGVTPREGHIKDDPEWLNDYADRVIEMAGEDLDDMRNNMKGAARERFGWDKVAQQWSRLFTETSQKKGRTLALKED